MSVRLFVAADLPGPAREALSAFRDAAADPAVWRAVRDDALHLTLAFLGHRPEEDVDAAAHVLDASAAPAPRLALGPALLLPPRRARVLCTQVADRTGALASLQARVSDRLAAAGLYEPERRPFRAHATVARLRPGARPPRGTDGLPVPEPLEFAVAALTLYRSQLGRAGARYEPLHRVALVP